MLFAVARNEFLSLFRTPLGWAVLAVSQFLLGLIYFILINLYLNKQQLAVAVSGVSNEISSTLFGASIYILMVVTPVLAMRTISYERHRHTIGLLLAAPVHEAILVLGKFAGLVLYLSLLLISMLLMNLVLGFATSVDPGLLFTAMFGVLLIIITFTAISLYISSLTAQPSVAVIGAMGVLLFMFFLSSLALTRIGWLDDLINWISLFPHLESFLQGTLNSLDISYYLLVSSCALILTCLHFQKLRQHG